MTETPDLLADPKFLMADKEFMEAYRDRNHVLHEHAQTLMVNAYARKFPEVAPTPPVADPAAARAALAELMKTPAYQHRDKPGHAEAVARALALNGEIAGNAPTTG
jgi:hypothetical protein